MLSDVAFGPLFLRCSLIKFWLLFDMTVNPPRFYYFYYSYQYIRTPKEQNLPHYHEGS